MVPFSLKARSLGLLFLWMASAVPAPALGPALRVAVGEHKPPYDVDSPSRGIEYELLHRIIEGMGRSPQIVMVPNARAQEMLAQGTVDATFGTTGKILSQPYIAYQNAAMTLTSRGLAVRSVTDLRNLRVTAFQNAHLFLGPEFQAMSLVNPDYHEVSPQLTANRLLFAGRTDVVIAEVNIFAALNRQIKNPLDPGQPVTVHRVFPPTRYSLVFRDPALRDSFDRSLKKVLATDAYEQLARKYLGPNARASFRP